MKDCHGLFALSTDCNTCLEREFCFAESTGSLTNEIPDINQDFTDDNIIVALEKIFGYKKHLINIAFMRLKHKKLIDIAKKMKITYATVFNYMNDIKVISPQIYHIIKKTSRNM